MRPRRAALIGPGRLGSLVAHALNAAGTPVTRLAGGSEASRARLMASLSGVRDVPIEEVAQGVDLVVIATPDAAITDVVDRLVRADALDESLGGDPFDVPEEARIRYHAALALASNAVGAAVVTSRRVMIAAGIDDPARLVAPIAHASVDAAARSGASALTGPVVRGDVATVAAHLAALETDLPESADAYRDLSRVVLDAVRPALAPDVAAELDALLDVRRGGRA
jgi:predicted short-subunit dehydrogenase-like oxidoreductase (DUF2520 family)